MSLVFSLSNSWILDNRIYTDARALSLLLPSEFGQRQTRGTSSNRTRQRSGSTCAGERRYSPEAATTTEVLHFPSESAPAGSSCDGRAIALVCDVCRHRSGV